MKILSFAVPCYNSEAYMRKCIDSLLPGGEDVEIIIVDDGSSDGTAAIADEYEAKYPGICRAIHQENAGHGGAVNTGIANARGMYFKVVDSDDWLDTESYKVVLNRLKQFRENHLLREGSHGHRSLRPQEHEEVEEEICEGREIRSVEGLDGGGK